VKLTEKPERLRGKGGLTQLLLARALYRCGDYKGIGKQVLETYARDLRGPIADHARMILESR